MVNITTENVKGAIMLSKAMGIGAKEVGAMYASMMQMGMGQEKTRQILENTFKAARAYGVDASVLTKTVSDNIFKAQAYGFKDGVKGLTDMAIQAQRVGIGMELAEKAASKAFDPEGAIEMASKLQMLGGNMGGLTDVHSLMFQAQSDMGALQDNILKASSSMVDFNSKTGEFKISPEMRRNMRDQAEAMGMQYDEYAKAAIKFKKEQEVMSRIPLTAGFSEADKSFIASMAEIGPGGEIQIQMPGTDQILKGSDITAKKLEELKIAKEEAEKPIEDIAKEQLAVSDKMAKTLEEIKNAGIFGMGVEQGIKIPETIESQLISVAQNFSTTLATSIGNSTLPNTFLNAYQVSLQTLNTAITEFMSNVETAIFDAENKIREKALVLFEEQASIDTWKEKLTELYNSIN
jgi:enamine deaminase RidA (YjgF/YER057c/UK114 family)